MKTALFALLLLSCSEPFATASGSSPPFEPDAVAPFPDGPRSQLATGGAPSFVHVDGGAGTLPGVGGSGPDSGGRPVTGGQGGAVLVRDGALPPGTGGAPAGTGGAPHASGGLSGSGAVR